MERLVSGGRKRWFDRFNASVLMSLLLLLLLIEDVIIIKL